VEDEIEDDLVVGEISKVEFHEKKSKKETSVVVSEKYKNDKSKDKRKEPAENDAVDGVSDKEEEEFSAAADGSTGMFMILLNVKGDVYFSNS